MSAFVICSVCGHTEEHPDEHTARAEGWATLSIDSVVGHANQSEWYGTCPECAE